MLFSLPRKRGINIAKIRGNKVTDYIRNALYPQAIDITQGCTTFGRAGPFFLGSRARSDQERKVLSTRRAGGVLRP